MEDLFKKIVYTSVGLVAFTVEKLNESVDRLVKENKLTQEEGQKIVDDFLKNTEAKKDEFEAQLKTIAEKVVKGFNFAPSTEMEDLKARLESLEEKMKALKAATPKKEATA